MISPYVRRLLLAAELTRIREAANLTHQQLATKIGQPRSRSKISRLEDEAARVCAVAERSGSVVDELIAERRAEAARELRERHRTLLIRPSLFRSGVSGDSLCMPRTRGTFREDGQQPRAGHP